MITIVYTTSALKQQSTHENDSSNALENKVVLDCLRPQICPSRLCLTGLIAMVIGFTFKRGRRNVGKHFGAKPLLVFRSLFRGDSATDELRDSENICHRASSRWVWSHWNVPSLAPCLSQSSGISFLLGDCGPGAWAVFMVEHYSGQRCAEARTAVSLTHVTLYSEGGERPFLSCFQFQNFISQLWVLHSGSWIMVLATKHEQEHK